MISEEKMSKEHTRQADSHTDKMCTEVHSITFKYQITSDPASIQCWAGQHWSGISPTLNVCWPALARYQPNTRCLLGKRHLH